MLADKRLLSWMIGTIWILLGAVVPTGCAEDAVIKPGDKVLVTKGPAPMKVGVDTLATVEAGTELVAEKVQGNWVRVTITKDGMQITGWIQSTRLKTSSAKADSPPVNHEVTRPVGSLRSGPWEIRVTACRSRTSYDSRIGPGRDGPNALEVMVKPSDKGKRLLAISVHGKVIRKYTEAERAAFDRAMPIEKEALEVESAFNKADAILTPLCFWLTDSAKTLSPCFLMDGECSVFTNAGVMPVFTYLGSKAGEPGPTITIVVECPDADTRPVLVFRPVPGGPVAKARLSLAKDGSLAGVEYDRE